MADEVTTAPRKRGRPRKNPEPATMELATTGENKPAKQSRSRPDLAKFGQENVEAGDNAKFLQHALTIRNMPPIDIANPHEVERRIDWYFNLCVQDDIKPTVKGFCNSLRIVKSTLWNWKMGNYRAGTHEEMIVRAYDVLEELWEHYMQNGKINPMTGVFLGVNNFGYKDVKQVNLTPVVDNQPEAVDIAAIEAKYAELPEE